MLKQFVLLALRSEIGRQILTIVFKRFIEWLRERLISERVINSLNSITIEARNQILIDEFVKTELPKLLK